MMDDYENDWGGHYRRLWYLRLIGWLIMRWR